MENDSDYIQIVVPRSALPRLIAIGWEEVGVISNKVPAIVRKPKMAFFDRLDEMINRRIK